MAEWMAEWMAEKLMIKNKKTLMDGQKDGQIQEK